MSMAALVSHAMRRYPLSPSDGVFSSYNLKDNTSWSQKPEEGESALSRSMRYADPWLYGSVRGAPAGALVLTPAFVLCSCPDFLNGSKKGSPKRGPVLCKKCKGTRVSLNGNGDTKFGTVRCYPTSSSSALHAKNSATQSRAGTVRVTSSSRPSILPNNADPYDLMRRSRLNTSNDTTSPFRRTSVSPVKKTNEATRLSGRRSILECDINPYDLMSMESDEPVKDSSITFVNGQRIRIRPPAPDPDYEDIEEPTVKPETISQNSDNTVKAQKSKPNRVAPDPPLSPSLIMSEVDRNNRFKSILKKSTNFTKYSTNSVRSKGGSHFYLPFPKIPRKKVQFSVECSEKIKTTDVNMDEDTNMTDNYKEETEEEPQEAKSNISEGNMDQKVCKLRRSTSERFRVEPQKVVFLDTMALRVKTPRGDARDTFNKCDLEKLDGLVPKRRLSPRPKDPPPRPPSPDFTSKNSFKTGHEEVNKCYKNNEEVDVGQESNSGENNEKQGRKDEIQDSKDGQLPKNISVSFKEPIKRSVEASLEAVNTHESTEVTEDSLVEKTELVVKPHHETKLPQAPPRKKSINKGPIISVQISDQENRRKSTELVENVQMEPPVPRKRSGSKSPNINDLVIIEPAKIKIEMGPVEHREETKNQFFIEDVGKSETTNQIESYPTRTVVQITPTSPVHKIQIKNESPEDNIQTISISENAQRKTSILINGDDCYSTVNVSDDVPLYQSSVVVRDYGIREAFPSSNKKSSSVYITGSFNQESSTFTCFKSNNETPETNESETCICKHSTKNKEVTKEEKEVSTGNEVQNNDNNGTSTPDVLREILRDPVEAVKRNLVPHVCGKSDVTRRPRDLKLKTYYPLLSVKETASSTPEPKENPQRNIDRSPLRVCNFDSLIEDEKDACSEHSSSTQYEFVDPGSDCYTDHSNRSSLTEEELSNRTKFYELLADSALLEVSENEDHHYECINKNDPDPIYEEIEVPPPLPSNPPPINLLDDLKLDKEFTTRSIFEGASKYDILSYLVDAKERGIVPEDSYTFSSISVDDSKERGPKICHMSSVSDSSEENSLVISSALIDEKNSFSKSSEVERNDSGVGSETSKSSLSKYRTKPVTSVMCEDCEASLESLGEDEQMLCRKCLKKRSERKEIIMEIVETEEKYSKDLQIILEEFYQPMLVAGLLSPEQLSTIFLNAEELLENSQSLAERLRDAVEIAIEQGDEDLLTVNMGKLFLEAAPMLHAFETYCVRQGPASLLLASLEKEKELLRIFLRVSQMENTLLRRMNLNSFLMVPVQRVTKYPLLLARLYKVTPNHYEAREQLKEAQHKIELHLNHMNSQTKDVPSKLWRRIGSSSGRRPSTEMDLVNIKLRKIAVDVLEWNHEEAKFALEGKLWFTQPTDNNWRKGRTIKLSPVNALLVINGKPSNNSKNERDENALVFPKHSATREAALLLVRDKNGRYSMLRDPLYLDRCVIASDPAWQSYFEVQELLGKDTFIFKAEDEEQTKIWYQQLQFHAQGMGAWRKRRNALANIMMNGMGLRL